MFVKPGTDTKTGKSFVVRIPRTYALLPEEGAEVPETAFWIRRKRDKDVIACDQPKAAEAEAPKEQDA